MVSNVSLFSHSLSQARAPLTQLDVNLAQMILLYLHGREVALVKHICKRLRVLANDEKLWEKLFKKDFPQRELKKNSLPSIEYQIRYKIEKNWKISRYRSQVLNATSYWTLQGQINLDDQRVVYEGDQSSIHIWNSRTNVIEQRLAGSPGHDLKYILHQGDLLVTYYDCGYGGKVQVWNKMTNLLLWEQQCYPKHILDESELIGVIHEGPYPNLSQVVIWDLQTGSQTKIIPAENIYSSTLTLQESYLVFSNKDGDIKLYEKKSGDFLRELKSNGCGSVSCLLLYENYLIAGYAQGVILLWNRDTGSLIQMLASNLQEIFALQLQENLLFVTCTVGVLCLDVKTRLKLYTIKGVTAVYLDRNHLFVSFAMSGTVEIRQSKDAKFLRSLPGTPDDPLTVINVDSARVITHSKRRIIKIWSKHDGSLIDQLSNIYYCTLTEDRLFMASKGSLKIRDYSIL